jgi:CRISPR/Cas system-associated exonuclease Cas4 (RecB family)
MVLITASDLAAWDYCPRQVYFRRIKGIKPEKKEVMVKGSVKHKVFENLISMYKDKGNIQTKKAIDQALSLHAPELEQFGTDLDEFRKHIEWSFGILEDRITKDDFPIPEHCEKWLESNKLGLKARVDAIFQSRAGEWVVADLKTKVTDYPGTKMQIGAGALLFEEQEGVKVNNIRIISHLNWMEKEIPLTDELRQQIIATRDEIAVMIETRNQPAPTDNPHKCAVCDFKDTHCFKDKPKSWFERVFG